MQTVIRGAINLNLCGCARSTIRKRRQRAGSTNTKRGLCGSSSCEQFRRSNRSRWRCCRLRMKFACVLFLIQNTAAS
jgi:hypothetical protein